MQNELILYRLERAIYRLSISKYADRFTLKGGIFLYALFDRDFPRATRDIDLLASKVNNEAQNLKTIFEDIFSIECNDALHFDLSSLAVKNITEFKEYHGVNISIIAFLDRTRVPISMDIGFGDAIYPDKVTMEFPTLLDMESPKIYAYSMLHPIVHHSKDRLIAGLIFAFSSIILYMASTMYHATPIRNVKDRKILRVIDHCSIFILVAGTC